MTQTQWPMKSIFWWGTFGAESPVGRRFQRRATAALLLMAAVHAAAAWAPREYHAWWWPVNGVAFAFIGREWWRYIESLDELERRLQLEAAAWTYVVGIAVIMGLAGVSAATGFKLSPGALILLEPLRTWRLSRLVRKF